MLPLCRIAARFDYPLLQMQLQLKSHSLRAQGSQLKDIIQQYKHTQYWSERGMQEQAAKFERLMCNIAAIKFFVSSDKQAFFLHLQSCPELAEAKQLMASYFSDLEDWALLLTQDLSQCQTYRLLVAAKVFAEAEGNDSLSRNLIPVCSRLVGSVTALKQLVIEQLSPAAAWFAAYLRLYPAEMAGVAPVLAAMGNKLRLPTVPGVMDELVRRTQALRAVSLGADLDVNICRVGIVPASADPASAAAGATVAAAAGPSNTIPSTVNAEAPGAAASGPSLVAAAAAAPAGFSPAAVVTSLDPGAAAATGPSDPTPNVLCTEALSVAASSPNAAASSPNPVNKATLSPGAAASSFRPDLSAAAGAAIAWWTQECLSADHPAAAAARGQGLAEQSIPSFL